MWQLEYDDNGKKVLDLHPQFYWIDELDYSPVVQSAPIYTLTGALVIEQALKKAGRPITLSGDNVWLALHTVQALQALADKLAFVMRLVVPDGRTFSVLFARPALSNLHAIKAVKIDERNSLDRYQCNLHFITV